MTADPLGSTPDRDALAREWLRVVAATAYVPRSADEILAFLGELVDSLLAGDDGTAVGVRMVEGGLIGPHVLPRTLALLAGHLPGRAALLGSVAAGYAEARHQRTLAQQENMKLALLSAKQRADRERQDSEDRFREVFRASSVGMAVTDAGGRFVETNPALAAILACPADELAGRSLAEFIAPDIEPPSPYELSLGTDRKRLLREDGETAWVYVTVSEPSEAGLRVTMVQDLSELRLLQDRLGHQLLHDAVTGVANRSHFQSRLEAIVDRGAPADRYLLCCLDIDAFALVNTTHGHEVGDRLLRTVAERLRGLFPQPDALVARIGGDEFAVVVPDSSDTGAIAELITTELAEPDYAHTYGLGAGVCMGFARAARNRMSSAELFRAAESALRRAKATGHGQWAEYDSQADAAVRRAGRLATALPAAWENGELEVAFQPVVALPGADPIGCRALVVREGRDVAEPAETIGLAVPLGTWTLAGAAERCASAHAPGGFLRVLLSPLQSADADLSASVNRALADSGLEPTSLEIALDTASVLTARGDAQDNLRTLADIGVRVGLHGFSGGPREIAAAERFRVHVVLLADPFEGWRPDWLPPDAAPVRATRHLVAALKAVGAAVGVLGVRDDAEARWWADLRIDTAEGPAFGLPSAHVTTAATGPATAN